MRGRLALVLLTVAGGVGFTPPAFSQSAKEIRWRTDYTTARNEAKGKNLPIFIDFYMRPCPPCEKLERETFTDPKVSELLAEKFICLKIDGPQESNRDKNLVAALSIEGYPTMVIAAPDGKILDTLKGFQAANLLTERLQRVVGTTTNFDWMLASFKEAQKFYDGGKFALAIPTLLKIKEEGAGRPVHTQAVKLLDELDLKAQAKLAEAKRFQDKNMTVEAIQAYTAVVRDFAGLPASRDAETLINRVVQSQDHRNRERTRQAREMLALAKDFLKNKEYFLCLDRCDRLKKSFGDLPEAHEASQIAADINNSPEILQNACDNLSDRLGTFYLHLADSYLKKGQRQQAMNCLERVIIAFPGSHHAESAQIRRAQLQGTAPVPVGFKQGN